MVCAGKYFKPWTLLQLELSVWNDRHLSEFFISLYYFSFSVFSLHSSPALLPLLCDHFIVRFFGSNFCFSQSKGWFCCCSDLKSEIVSVLLSHGPPFGVWNEIVCVVISNRKGPTILYTANLSVHQCARKINMHIFLHSNSDIVFFFSFGGKTASQMERFYVTLQIEVRHFAVNHDE